MKKGFFKRLFSKRSVSPSDDFWYSRVPSLSDSGVSVDEESSLNFLVVYSCVSLIAESIASLPLQVFKRSAGGSKTPADRHPLYEILHSNPNIETNSFNWRETCQSHLLLWGNTFSEIIRDARGYITEIYQLPSPGGVRVEREKGRILYKWTAASGEEIVREASDVFHIPGFGFNGLVGKSPVRVASEAIGLGLATEKFGAKYFGSGTHPSGVLEMDEYLGDNKEDFIKSFREQYSGLGKSHSVVVLEGGLKYKSLSMPLEEAQFLQTRKFQKTDIVGFYKVPPHKVGILDNASFSNIEQQSIDFAQTTMLPWVKRWESAINSQLFSEKERRLGYFAEFAMDGLLRGDTTARGDFYQKLWGLGVLSINEIRAKENLNPIEGGDKRYIPLNYIGLGDEVPMAVKPIGAEDNVDG